MLRLVLGRAGAGKTEAAVGWALKIGRRGGKAVLLVPEQFTFEAEKKLLERAGPRAGLFVEVLSFKRLAHRVFSLYGGAARRYIGETGRYVMMRMALRQVADMLGVYGGQAGSAPFVRTMVDAVEEARTFGATPERLEELSDKVGKGLLSAKLSDVRLIFSAYASLLGANRFEQTDQLTALAVSLEHHHFFEGKTVVVDSFKGFTPQERQVLTRVLAQADDVFVTLCAEGLGGADGLGLFAPVEKTARQLIAAAGRAGVPVAKPVVLGSPKRFETPGLRFLEQRIFRGADAQASERTPEEGPLPAVFPERAPEIHFVTAENFYEEARFAAQTIAALVRDAGCRYRDVVVIAGEPETYRGIIDPVFEKYGVPLFLDARRAVDTHPLMVYVLSLFEIVLQNFRPGQVARCLKTGLTDWTVEEISELENYTLVWNIRGFDGWNQPWTEHPDGFGRPMTDADAARLARLNELRLRVMRRLSPFREGLSSAKKSDAFCRLLYRFLQDGGVEQRLPRLCEQFRGRGELELADEYRRMWEALVGVLDQLSLTLGGFTVEPKEFYELLKLGISGCDLGQIPAALDEVTFGGAERIRTGEARYVFVLGLAEGMFPRPERAGGLFTRAERRRLGQEGLELAPTGREQAAEERFFAYKAFTCASRGVWLCCPRAGVSGSELRPSVFFREARALFPQNALEDLSESDPLDAVQNEKTAFETLALLYRQGGPLRDALYAYFSRKPAFAARLAALERAANRRPFAFADPRKARQFYGGELRVSPSRVELHRQCRFAYFCRYDLSAHPRRPAQLEAPEIGTLIHFVLERLLRDGGGALSQLSGEQLEGKTRTLMRQYADECLGGLADKPERFRYQFSQLEQTALLLVRHIVAELSQSEFQPVDYELRIARDGDVPPVVLDLPGGGKLAVEGRVDRVDLCRKNGRIYLRVIDYKTGAKRFSLSDVAQGLNLQMLIYLFTLCRQGEKRYGGKPLPAGVLYVPARRPSLTEPRGADAAEVEREQSRALRMNGLVLGDVDVVLGMEKNGAGIYLPVSLRKAGGKVTGGLKGSTLATMEQMGLLTGRIERSLEQMAAELRSGDIAARPVRGGGYDPCSYCDFSDVCGFEPGNEVETLRADSDEDVWAALAAKEPEKKAAGQAAGRKGDGKDGAEKLDRGTKAGD